LELWPIPRKVWFVNAKGLRIIAMLMAAATASGQGPAQTKRFILYQTDRSFGCVAETNTATAMEMSAGKTIYQVFWSRTTPRRELFSVQVGKYVGQDAVKWWNYGIADEIDFNSDGLPDYLWYGGDDTGYALYLFLSSDGGYKRTDVLKTVQAAWRQRFHKAAPDLGGDLGGYTPGDTVLERLGAGLVLLATVEHKSFEGVTTATYRFRIRQPDFKR
jgi:hypothetical protein